jgi:hypothetical protein
MPIQPQNPNVLVQGSEVATDAFAAVIGGNPRIKLVAKVANDIVVLRATESDLNALKTRFPGLIIEPDQELNY